MTALQQVKKLNQIETAIQHLLNQGISEDHQRIITLRTEYNRIEAEEPSDSFKRELDNDNEDLIML